MFWKKKEKKNEAPKERNLFREAFIPPKKPILPKQPSKRSFQWRFPGVTALWALLSLTIVYVLFVSSFHSIMTVSVTGSDDVPADRLESFILDRMSGNRLLVFPKSNFFLVSSADMEQALRESFPKLQSAGIEKRFPNRIDVIVSERDRVLLWCASGTCSLIGDDGVARDARFAEQLENEAFLFRIEDTSGRKAALGDRILDEGTLSRFLRLEKELRGAGVVTITAHASSPSRVSGEFRFTTTEGWDVLVSTDSDPVVTIAALRVVLTKEIPDEKRAKLRSIDLRTEKKVFYSFIQGEPASGDAEPVTMDEKPKEEKKK